MFPDEEGIIRSTEGLQRKRWRKEGLTACSFLSSPAPGQGYQHRLLGLSGLWSQAGIPAGSRLRDCSASRVSPFLPANLFIHVCIPPHWTALALPPTTQHSHFPGCTPVPVTCQNNSCPPRPRLHPVHCARPLIPSSHPLPTTPLRQWSSGPNTQVYCPSITQLIGGRCHSNLTPDSVVCIHSATQNATLNCRHSPVLSPFHTYVSSFHCPADGCRTWLLCPGLPHTCC